MNHENITITAPEDCGNAPKKAFIQNAVVGFATSDIDFIQSSTTENVQWEIVGTDSLQGQAAITEHLENHPISIKEINIDHIITHGKTGAAKGTYQTVDGDTYHFCHFYHFVSAGKKTINDITSYVIHQ